MLGLQSHPDFPEIISNIVKNLNALEKQDCAKIIEVAFAEIQSITASNTASSQASTAEAQEPSTSIAAQGLLGLDTSGCGNEKN